MTPQERDLLDRCLQDLRRARPDRTDPEAQAMVAAALRDNPDAAYVLVQHAIVSDRALQEAGAHIEALEGELAERDRGGADRAGPQGGGGMFGGLFGGGRREEPPRWGGPTAVPATGYAQGGGYDRGRFAGGPFTGGGGLGGFLQQAGVAAAGVAGGAFLFQGLSHMFGGSEPHGDGGGLFGGGDERQGFFGGEDRDVAEGGAQDLFDGGDSGGDGDWG